ncbi:branched-chain amino acid ABC transporter permease [Rhodoplanes sp. TEM]|uniref:Branched-chain amino acid ABC transporter permease n=1 Tax=Rhodoplanes tepidamans TaxID=200616 RepID=A0ABT5J4Z2_RHOTP|nr:MULTISPECIES: branched-chain amino acid ABC transporter permease [Rhodoplanes]MDC7784710.1 branched-chain amino acid ABC transporter permease [Rhodoplanes tepidamans]MDC7982177.1 branched-chain amino acid ABC transporter permease [Rhodoplanes sp. TEM]MDQ0356181.1 branched-chain amino acid transport system permease protein [Rhodoplanes tepidamans]
MTTALFVSQLLNGLQLGVILFLVAAGLTLVFGVMDFINLAHGVQYMLGAYLVAVLTAWTGSFAAGLLLGLVGALVLGFVLEVLVFRHLTRRDHLEQVLGTFGVILIVTELVRILFGSAPLAFPTPAVFAGSVTLLPGLNYPVWRLVILVVGLAVAVLLWYLVNRTRLGMLVRAGSTHPETVSALGVDIDRLFLVVFAFGAMLAGLAGAMAGPLVSVEPTMGDRILIVAFVVVVIGGIGSIKGAFVSALVVGLVDTLGRAFAPDLLKVLVGKSAAAAAGPALSSMLIYLLMAVVLSVRPSGLFGGRSA